MCNINYADYGDKTLRKGQIWTHVKSKGVYIITGFCKIEATDRLGVLYVDNFAKDIALSWCRDAEEFLDGRFEQVISHQ